MSNPILVTGANGFIGRRLVQVLTEHDYIVRRCTRSLDGSSDVVVGEIGPETDWKTAILGATTVVHLAALVSDRAKEPIAEFRRVNVGGTLALAHHCMRAGVKRFVYLSSIGVNGIQISRPFTELDAPDPREPYAISKCEAEQGLSQLIRSGGMEVVIIRPPLVYGPDAPGNFGRLLRMVSKGVPLPFGAIHNKRSYVALDNLIDLIITCIEHPAAANETFLAGDGEDLSSTELLHRIAKALDKPARLFPVPVFVLTFLASLLGKGDMVRRFCDSLQVDISKAQALLGWKPHVSVDEGLLRAVKNFKK